MATYKGHNEDSSGNLLLSIGNGMTATVETGSTASQSYTKGAYVFFNNRFCKTTTSISSGSTLTIGSNLSETSIGAELTSHLRSSDGKEFYFDVKNGTYGYYPSASKVSSEFVPFGGTLSETELWTNPSPTSTFSGQDVSLNSAYTNYKFLAVYYKLKPASTTEHKVLFPKELIADCPYSSSQSTEKFMLYIGACIPSYNRARSFGYNSTTSFHFGECNIVASSGSTSAYLIPTKICGVN